MSALALAQAEARLEQLEKERDRVALADGDAAAGDIDAALFLARRNVRTLSASLLLAWKREREPIPLADPSAGRW